MKYRFTSLFMHHNKNFITPEETILSTIDEILWTLKDGRWHTLREIIEKSHLAESKAKLIISFLNKYSFIQLDENEKKAKLLPQMLSFINEIQSLEKDEISSHESLEGTISIKEFASLPRGFKRV